MKLWQKLELLIDLYDISFCDGCETKTPYQVKAKKIAEKWYDKVINQKLKKLKKLLAKNYLTN